MAGTTATKPKSKPKPSVPPTQQKTWYKPTPQPQYTPSGSGAFLYNNDKTLAALFGTVLRVFDDAGHTTRHWQKLMLLKHWNIVKSLVKNRAQAGPGQAYLRRPTMVILIPSDKAFDDFVFKGLKINNINNLRYSHEFFRLHFGAFEGNEYKLAFDIMKLIGPYYLDERDGGTRFPVEKFTATGVNMEKQTARSIVELNIPKGTPTVKLSVLEQTNIFPARQKHFAFTFNIRFIVIDGMLTTKQLLKTL